MEQQNLNHLFNREQYELNICEQNIALFNKYIDDYEQLKSRLSTLADKTYHNIMVPIAGTNIAFMPGYIHHTNEILVLLGDNYFVEKSTKEAMEFIERRIKFCNEKLDDLKQQKSMIDQWLKTAVNFKEENEKFVNITETCTEQEYQQWLKERNEKIMKQNQNKIKNKNETMTKEELNKIFAKYEDNDDDDNNNNNETIQSQIIERIDPKLSSSTEINKKSDQNRPKSKFKASRNKN